VSGVTRSGARPPVRSVAESEMGGANTLVSSSASVARKKDTPLTSRCVSRPRHDCFLISEFTGTSARVVMGLPAYRLTLRSGASRLATSEALPSTRVMSS
jgi:hypothetical protein